MKQEFERIYAEDRWGGGCGPGSTLEATVAYRRFVEEFIRCNEVCTVLDIGCGDGTVAAAIDWSNAHYIGIDIVPKLIEASAARRREGMEFRLLDATSDPLPDADLVLIKEVLQHWTNREILDFLPRLQRYRHVLVVNDVGTVRDPNRISPALNSDTFLDAGCRYRPVDLTSAPFASRRRRCSRTLRCRM